MNEKKHIRAIIGRFTHEVPHAVIERVLAKKPFEYIVNISTGETPKKFSAIPSNQQQWLNSGEIRGCHYADVNWETLEPIDEQLIEKMHHCEAMFMDMVLRLEWKKSIPHNTRKHWYYQHLRFWNDCINRHEINLYLSAWMPHEIPDIIIYHLCKLKNIPTLYFQDVAIVKDAAYLENDIEESAVIIKPHYEKLLVQYATSHHTEKITLSEHFHKRYQALTQPAGAPPPTSVLHWNTYWESVWDTLLHQPLKLIHYLVAYCSPQGLQRAIWNYKRWRVIHKRTGFYNRNAIEPDLHCPFVYLALHYQPEASTIPMGGAYRDQLLIAQMLGAVLPKNIQIYVKEHALESGWLARNVDFYKQLLAIPNVRLIKRTFNTFTLREHCKAVATVTGTAGAEALFRGKPVLMFGHYYYQYARGVYQIHSTNDLIKAIREIVVEKKKPNLMECRLFLKAIEDTCIRGSLNPAFITISPLPSEAHIRVNSEAIVNALNEIEG